MSSTRPSVKRNNNAFFARILERAVGAGCGARDRASAVKLVERYVDGGDGLRRGVKRALEGCHFLDGGLAVVECAGGSVSAGGEAVADADLPGWLRGLIVAAPSAALDARLVPALEKARSAGTAADGVDWKAWGHHDQDRGKGARAPSSDDGGVPTKRALLPFSAAKYPAPEPSERIASLRNARIRRLDGPWLRIVEAAVAAAKRAVGAENFPTFAGSSARARASEPRVSATGVLVVDARNDAGVNINAMGARGFYPFHTDDRATWASLGVGINRRSTAGLGYIFKPLYLALIELVFHGS